MDLSIANIFIGTTCDLEFAHRTNLVLMKKFKKEILFRYKNAESKTSWTLSLVISPVRKLKKIVIHGPHIERKNKYYNYSANVPCEIILKSSNSVKTYSDIVKGVLIDILEKDFNE